MQGGFIAGSVPDPAASSANEMLDQALKTYLFYNLDPEIDCPNPGQMQLALSQADSVIAFTPYVSPMLKKYATGVYKSNKNTVINEFLTNNN